MATFARALCFITIFISFGSHSKMLNFLKPYAYKICPEVHGVIKKMGEPYPNQIVTLDVEYGETYLTYDAITDDNGKFEFSEVVIHRWYRPFVLNNNIVAIRIFTLFNDVDKQLWGSYIGTLEPKGFIVNNLIDLVCDLDNHKHAYGFKNEKPEGAPYWVYGICDLKGYQEKYNQGKDDYIE
ncbi:DUF6795 domain-containing protein [Thaumasiovibrio sp. DFM-14]|uniref:DUF6795 domain-containing protein n=1 Tax=Thaumasiovibrio sp. DFM-14 TaxID=3384792 RepID=UPI0039A354A1